MGQMPFALAQSEVNPVERKALFGDLHVHTNYSLDSYLGQNPNGPREAYRFAKGGTEMTAAGEPHALKTPLDFTAVTDHAEYLGEMGVCNINDEDNPDYDSEECQKLRAALEDADFAGKIFIFIGEGGDLGICDENRENCNKYTPKLWEDIQRAADEYDDRGTFTTLKAYEWSSKGKVPPGHAGGGIHRNIFFRNDTVPSTVWSAKDSLNPEDLWDWLDENCTGEWEALVIPHNANLSAGTAFIPYYYDQIPPMDTARALTQQRLERLVEVIQTKCESEFRPGLGNTDEFCGFEKLDRRPIYHGTPVFWESAAVQSVSRAPSVGISANPRVVSANIAISGKDLKKASSKKQSSVLIGSNTVLWVQPIPIAVFLLVAKNTTLRVVTPFPTRPSNIVWAWNQIRLAKRKKTC
ncbi:MAG: DUF3604 domain-containing protein [Okeania sp.]|nr:DUF3604 domain-containing protein [Okeania sp.]MEB3341781.1 DUF3604 domain-containing protein [Okeania sp.]